MTGEEIKQLSEATVILPKTLINFALQNTNSVGEFLKKCLEMSKWDTAEMEEFYSKYPGLHPDHNPDNQT